MVTERARDQAPDPTLLVARTLQPYSAPAVSRVIAIGLRAAVADLVRPRLVLVHVAVYLTMRAPPVSVGRANVTLAEDAEVAVIATEPGGPGRVTL
jgi:hypothetical protein